MTLLAELFETSRDLGRIREIAGVLVRYGFTDVVGRLGLAGALEKLGETFHWTEAAELVEMSTAQRVRTALEQLGPTFVKLGQLLSTRVDLFPPDWIEEFERLQDQVAPVEFESFREQVRRDLGMQPEEAFASFETRAIAAGSIAQVHGAVLHDGQRVVVKIRRPGIEQTVEADLRLLRRLARIADEQLPDAARFRLPALVEQFARSIRLELDLAAEARNVERMAANLKARFRRGQCPVVVPRIHREWSCVRINVQERIEGIPGQQVERLAAAGLDRRRIAVEGARTMLSTIIEDGFFHADPHPGNVM
ncbi:MAG: ubiquinone biosynthesis protein UbiB, partial [Gammaproteobacteria bacterium]|nr:ubiquinone biosynthesis protein UbiB [Gammaproteobacteria bacterium]